MLLQKICDIFTQYKIIQKLVHLGYVIYVLLKLFLVNYLVSA